MRTAAEPHPDVRDVEDREVGQPQEVHDVPQARRRVAEVAVDEVARGAAEQQAEGDAHGRLRTLVICHRMASAIRLAKAVSSPVEPVPIEKAAPEL